MSPYAQFLLILAGYTFFDNKGRIVDKWELFERKYDAYKLRGGVYDNIVLKQTEHVRGMWED